jgi:hypothetical protein
MGEPKGLGSYGLNKRVLPNHNFRMLIESGPTKGPYDLISEILDADVAVFRNRGQHVHAVDRNKPAGHGNPEKFTGKKAEILIELPITLAVAHIPNAIRIREK